MNVNFVKFFTYGKIVELKIGQKRMKAYMSFSNSNYSFIEFVNPTTFEIVKYVNVYHIRSTRLEKEKNVLVRIRDYDENFKIYFESSEEALKLKSHFDSMTTALKNYPFCEYSIKNLVRYAIYYTRLANIENTYKLEDISLMLKRMRIFLDDKTLEKLVRKSVINMEAVTNFDFRRIFKVLMVKEELVQIYKRLLKISAEEKIKKRKLPLNLFHEWLSNEQRSTKSLDELAYFFQQIKAPNIFRVEPVEVSEIDFEEFSTYFFTPANLALNLDKLKKYPMNDVSPVDCFCSASKYTYLLGDKTYGKPSIEGYERALENGCRALEISCWDGPDGKPIVTHGKTVISKLEVEDVLKFLSRQAFKYSQMPLILFLEVHCSKAQRDVLSGLLTKIFGDQLNMLTKDHFYLRSFPRLEKLKGKILVKYQAAYPSFLAEEWNENLANKKTEGPLEPLDSITTLFEEPQSSSGLKSIFGIAHISQQSLDKSGQNKIQYGAILELTKQHFGYTDQISDNTEEPNENPICGWNAGIQFVQLNVNHKGLYSLINNIKFRENEYSGFVQKPYYLLETGDPSDIKEEKKIVILKVLSAQILDKHFLKDGERVYPYVQVRVLGMSTDTKINKPYTSKIVESNLFHLTFNEESFETQKLRFYYPELAFLVIEVFDAKQKQILKQGVLPVHYLSRGIKSVELYDKNNAFDSFSNVLMEIDC